MKKYFFGLSAVVLAIAFSAFTSKPKPATVTDLVFKGSPTSQSQVQDLTKFVENGQHASGFNCSSGLTDQAACKLIAVDIKYTHEDGDGNQILNTTATGGNPDNEPRITGITATSVVVSGVTYWVIDQISYTDASTVTRSTSEDILMQNGTKQ